MKIFVLKKAHGKEEGITDPDSTFWSTIYLGYIYAIYLNECVCV